MNFYRNAGFGIIDEREGPQDYIGVELKFMSLLAYREMESWKNGNENDAVKYHEYQKDFLENHILRWVPEFCRIVEREAKEEFYAVFARVVEEYLNTDYEFLKEVAEMLKRS